MSWFGGLTPEDKKRLDQAASDSRQALNTINEHTKVCDQRQKSIDTLLTDVKQQNQRILNWIVTGAGALILGVLGILFRNLPAIHFGS